MLEKNTNTIGSSGIYFRLDLGGALNHEAGVFVADAQLDDELFVASGTSKRDPHDRPNDTVGELLAIGRALEYLGRKMQKRAWGYLRHQEDVQERKRKARARKEAEAKTPKKAEQQESTRAYLDLKGRKARSTRRSARQVTQ